MSSRVLAGFDPGLASSGFGIIRIDGSSARHLSHGVITTSTSESDAYRIKHLHSSVSEILKKYKPVYAGVESIYFAKNIASAIPVAQARGAILLACAQLDIPVVDLSPPQIKQRITGVGRAEKRQVQEMIRLLLGLKEIPDSDHAADALAAAYCLWQEASEVFRQ